MLLLKYMFLASGIGLLAGAIGLVLWDVYRANARRIAEGASGPLNLDAVRWRTLWLTDTPACARQCNRWSGFRVCAGAKAPALQAFLHVTTQAGHNSHCYASLRKPTQGSRVLWMEKCRAPARKVALRRWRRRHHVTAPRQLRLDL